MLDDLVVHEFMFSYDRNGSLCYANLEDLAKTNQIPRELEI